MKDWKHHYEEAEAYLKKAVDPNLPADQVDRYIRLAGVHATLAEAGVDQEEIEAEDVQETVSYQDGSVFKFTINPSTFKYVPDSGWSITTGSLPKSS